MLAQTIAHYRVQSKIGAGGMGEVYRATDSKLGRIVRIGRGRMYVPIDSKGNRPDTVRQHAKTDDQASKD